MEKLLRNLVAGKPSTSFLAKMCPNNYQYETGSFRTFHYNDIALKVDIHDYVGHYLYFGFEDKGHIALMNLVNAGDSILDIGTNIGSTILQFASIIGDDGVAVGFEPDPQNFKSCAENIKLNNFTNINVYPFGLGNTEGSFNMIVDTPSNRGGNRISQSSDSIDSYKVDVKVLDNEFDSLKMERVDLIKIDVEGFEMNVLFGAEGIVDKYRPKMFIEVNDNSLKKNGFGAKELVLFLQNKGYEMTNAYNGSEITCKTNFSNCHLDIIALPN